LSRFYRSSLIADQRERKKNKRERERERERARGMIDLTENPLSPIARSHYHVPIVQILSPVFSRRPEREEEEVERERERERV
jgi:hypothetical protein